VPAIETAFRGLRDAGSAPSEPEAQPVLIEALFQMLDGLENDPADPDIHALACNLDAATAEQAVMLLKMVNFPEGGGNPADLDDSTLLLISALTAATGARDEADRLLEAAEHMRFDERFRKAAFLLRCRIIDDSDLIVDHLSIKVLDGLDHPELWRILPQLLCIRPDMVEALDRRLMIETMFKLQVTILRELCLAASGHPAEALRRIDPIAMSYSLAPMVQGARFHIQSLLDPHNPVYDLTDRFCTTPFEVIDVLDGASHLCCASWLPSSIGDLAQQPWSDVWNSDIAQDIRASIHDGSFRHCNKTACPKIGGNVLPTKTKIAALSDAWRDVVETKPTRMAKGPHRVNLAYDTTCNLSCPSCRTEKIAANAETRARFDTLQETAILPLLRESKLVFITGSGDPFASKNFRKLMERLGPEEYPDLRFQVMTNGMLFNRREWDRFPALHNRVAYLRISLDAATGPTHELLRRGARWPVMEENLAFAAELRAAGLIDRLDLTFVVQTDNYREMGDAVDLAYRFGADSMAFFRLTNWGTYTPAQYARHAVFMPSHPEHPDFIEAMQDPRLKDPMAEIFELNQFVRPAEH